MIREIKKKQTKIGTIISVFLPGQNTEDEAKNLESMNAFSAFVTIHTIGRNGEVANGVSCINHKAGPKLKNALGHHLSLIRGDQLFALVLPSVKFLGDISKVYEFAENNRMERAYGFFIGNSDRPSVVAFTGALAEHLFHAIPDNLEMTGDGWLQWVHEWAPKAMMAHRYFDANALVSIAVPEIVPTEVVVVGGITIVDEPSKLKPYDFVGDGTHKIDLQSGEVSRIDTKPDVIEEKPTNKKRKWNPFS